MLPTNYRCCSRVVEVARALIEASPLREELPLLSPRNACVGVVRSIVCKTRQDEIDAISREVYRATRTLEGASSIALLCRLRADCKALSRSLKEYGVEYFKTSSGFGGAGEAGVGGGGDEGAAAKALLAWLRLVINPNDDDAFITALAMPGRTGFAGESSVGLRYLRALAAEKSCPSRKRNVSLLVSAVHAARHRWPALAPTGAHNPSPPRLNQPQQEALTTFLHDYNNLRTAALKSNSVAVHGLLPTHAERIGLADALAKDRIVRASKRAAFKVTGGPGASITSGSSEDDGEGCTDAGQQHRRVARRELDRLLETAARVSDSIKAFADGMRDPLIQLRRFTDELALAAYDEMDNTDGNSRGARSAHVVVTTIHQSKGLEWDCVYVCHMQDGTLPLLPRGLQPNSLEYVEQLEEERRLAYVAFTRARRSLVLTWSEGPAAEDCQTRRTAAPQVRLVRSRFLSTLPHSIMEPSTPPAQRVQ